jgi:hypothetical protein
VMHAGTPDVASELACQRVVDSAGQNIGRRQ